MNGPLMEQYLLTNIGVKEIITRVFNTQCIQFLRALVQAEVNRLLTFDTDTSILKCICTSLFQGDIVKLKIT